MESKIIVSPTYQIARYWQQQGKLPKNCTVVTDQYQIRGFSRNPNDYIFVHGKEFDYPPMTDKFYGCLEALESIFIGYENVSDMSEIRFVKTTKDEE